MTPFMIWEKMIKAKVYTKTVATTRVNIVYAVGQLTNEEYTVLIDLIAVTYPDAA